MDILKWAIGSIFCPEKLGSRHRYRDEMSSLGPVLFQASCSTCPTK